MEMPLKSLSYYCGRCHDLQKKLGHLSRSIKAEECGTLKATSNNFPGFGNIHVLRMWLMCRIKSMCFSGDNNVEISGERNECQPQRENLDRRNNILSED